MKILRLKELGAIVGVGVFFVLFMFISERFLSIENLASTFTMASELGIVAIGITMLMISGEFDLSVGSTYAVVPMIMAIMMNHGVPSSKILKFFGGRLAGDLRYSGAWFIVLAIIFGLILERTTYGNWVFATGGNPGAAKALGIPTERVKLVNFVMSGLLAGIAGITTFGRFKIIDPTLGQGMELEAIASAVIGGSLLTGGYGSILGTFIGAFMIGMVRSGLVLAGAPAYWYRAFIGVILVIAAIINARIRKKVAG
ncbi:MAG: ABC transporter permease [Thermotoga sp. 4484_232]|nr:MAG: ABC transporter permease [Thermotoga sp. 4484_232]